MSIRSTDSFCLLRIDEAKANIIFIYECRCNERLLNGSERVYYESIKREPKIRGIKKYRCDERLQTKTKEFTRLPYTGLNGSNAKKERTVYTFFLS
jgi:hypothetical protein